MEYKAIESLIEKYFEGQTSLQDEKQLGEFFKKKNIPEHLQQYQPLFNFFDAEREVKISQDFEVKLENALNSDKPEAKIRHLRVKYLRVAAAIAMVVGVIWLVNNLSDSIQKPAMVSWEKYEINDPEKAKEELFKALALVSNKYNKAEATAKKNLLELSKMNVSNIRN